MKRVTMLLIATLLLLPRVSRADEMTLKFDHYYDGDQMVDAVKTLHKKYGKLTELRSLGKSEEGRDIWLLTINNPATGTDTDKPGIYVDGAIHGNEIQATEVCLYLASYLLDKYESNETIRELVDSRAFYIVPTVNVDNRARFFKDPAYYSSRRSGMVPYDDDRDGVADEDDYDDLDGDGEILMMRIADPFGDYKVHPDDPRVMEQVREGEVGQWRLIGREGIDNDGDGQLNEDPEGYLDMNRNWGFAWQPPYVQSGAGDYPMSGMVPEAISQFILSKPNLVFTWAFHNSGGLFVRGPGSNYASPYPPQDVAVYDYLGHEGEKIIPGYRYIIGSEDMYTTHGDFDEWMYSVLGVYGFTGELFMSNQERYRRSEEEETEEESDNSYYGGTPDIERQKFNDMLTHGEMFREWKTFKHPQFGEVEIGGWRTFTTRIPPLFQLPEMVHRAASAVIFTASQAPEVELELVEQTPLGNGLTRVRVRARNLKSIPSLSSSNVRHKVSRPDVISIEGKGISVVSGGFVRNPDLNVVRYEEEKPERLLTSVPSFGSQDVQWIVRGSGTATVTYDAMKATNRELTVRIK